MTHGTATAPTVYTIGHSTHPIAEFIGLLAQVPIELLIDVRSIPRSRTNPQFNSDVLPHSLQAAGIGYRHLATLGGRRHRCAGSPPSANTLWRNSAFRNYADYAQMPEFRSGLEQLRTLAAAQRCAIMCSEAVWWRCHRRIISDYLLAAGTPVAHIMAAGKIVPAALTPGAQPLSDGRIVYPGDPQGANDHAGGAAEGTQIG
jgi:uncharacterized protein (DUF488 family)